MHFFLHLQKLSTTRFAGALLFMIKTGLVEPESDLHPNLNGSSISGFGFNANTQINA